MPFADGQTPPFVNPTMPNQASQNQALLAILQSLSKGGQPGTPGTPQPASPLVSKGVIGQVPQMPGVPQVAGAGAGAGAQPAMPGGGAAPRMAGPMGPATPNQPAPGSSIESGLFKSGFEFASPKGRDAAVTASAIQGISQFITQAKNKKEAKTKAQAENYMSQITAAQQSGDQETLNLLLQDPKVISTLEKGLNYYMPKTPGEPAPPEATGIKAAIDKMLGRNKQQQPARLPAPNTPGGVAIPRAPQSASNQQAIQDLISKAALNAYQSDPTLAREAGIGTTLSGAQRKQAEEWQTGFGISPAQAATMSQEDKKLAQSWSEFIMSNQTELKKIASTVDMSKARNETELKAARISAGPAYARATIAKKAIEAQNAYREAMTKGLQGKANQIAMNALVAEEKDLRDNGTKLKGKDDDQAAKFFKEADERKKILDELRASQDTDINKIINNILGGPE